MTDPALLLEAYGEPPPPSELRLSGINVPVPLDGACSDAPATPNDAVLSDCTPGAEVFAGPLLERALPSAFPDAPATFGALDLNTPTPSREYERDLSFSSAFASALPPITQQSSMAAALAAKQGLRLPSFEALGIAAPHPDRRSITTSENLIIGAGPLSRPDDPLHQLSPFAGAGAGPGTHRLSPHSEILPLPTADFSQKSITHYISMLTPPDEATRSRWPGPGQYPIVTSAAMESPAHSDPEHTTPNLREGSASATPSTLQHIVPVTTTTTTSTMDLEGAGLNGDWADSAIENLLSNMPSDQAPGHALRVLSHALPSPSANGHIFPHIINRILEHMDPKPATWINVFHAVPGSFSLSDLPTSPPNTPGTVTGGDDYFTSKTFDTAVPVSDYEGPATALPKSARPAVPPGSINISIVERYIPPPTPNEAKSLFERNGRSLLSDRLVELSTHDGLLIFIYPTKTGAKTFMSEYLGPVLEPLIRSMTVINSLPSGLGDAVHQMLSIDHLVDFGELFASMRQFCRHLSTDNHTLSRFHPDRKTRYEVVYALQHEVTPSRNIWSDDWWFKQEKLRIRGVVDQFLPEAKKAREGITASSIIEQISKGVSKKSQPDLKPSKGIEVGVFVVKKTS